MNFYNNKSKIFFSVIIMLQLFGVNGLYAQTDDEYHLLKDGNEAYVEGNFQDAVEIYEKLIKAGYCAGELFYNLGNAYYRVGNYKAAILNYEKAKLYLPNDENIKLNLELSQRYIQDKLESVPEFFFVKWGKSFTNLLSEKAWSVFSIISFFIFLSGAAIFLFIRIQSLRKLAFYIGILALIISITSFINAGNQYEKINDKNTAIVFSPSVTVKSSPNQSGTDLFIIHEGLKVNIIGSSSGWREIKLSDGKVGWLPEESIEEI